MKQLFSFYLILFSLNSQAQLKWSFQDKEFNAGDIVPVKCWVSGFDSVGAFQYSLAYDTNYLTIRLDTPFTFTGLVPYTSDEFSHGLQSGIDTFFNYPKNHIKTAWADPYIHTYPNGHVYTIWFIAKDRGSVCESIHLLNGPFDMPIECWHENLIDPVEMEVGCIPARNPQWVGPKQEKHEDVRIYPNPTSDFIYVDSTEPVKVVVINNVGEVIYSDIVYSADEPIYVEQGVNFVRIVTVDKTIIKQVFKF